MKREPGRKHRRLHLTIGAALAGALVAVVTLFAGAAIAATPGNTQYNFPSATTNVTAGASQTVTVNIPSVSTSGSGINAVCWQLTGGVASSFAHTSGSFTVTTTGSRTITLDANPTASAGTTTLEIAATCGANPDTTTFSGSSSETMTITVLAAPAGAPVIQSISPPSGPNGTSVTVTLQAFALVTSVSFGGNSVTVGGPSLLTFVVNAPAGTGTVGVSATNANGTTTLADAYTYTPGITGLTPTSGPTGTSVTIAGSNFTGATGVTFGGTGAPFALGSDSSITATVPSGHSLGDVVDVRVTTTSGLSPVVTADQFTYASAPGPTITGVTGSCTIAGGGTISVTGTNFAQPALATIGGIGTNIAINTATTATVTCPGQSSVGSYNLVITSNGQPTNSFPVTYAAAAAPTVTAVSPNSGPLAGGNSVTITGTNFQSGGLQVMFGAAAATCPSGTVTSTSIVCTAPAGTGQVDVVVSVNSVASVTSSADTYTYTAAPIITSIDPATGGTGVTVTISGFNFSTATTVRFDTTTVDTADVTINSATSITVVVPASLATGTYDIRVISPSGTSAASDADQYTVTAGQTQTLTLQGQWTLIGWIGQDNIAVGDALKGGPNGPQNGTNDITDKVSVIWGFDTGTQTFKAYFPSAADIPGANDLTTLRNGVGYFVALTDPSNPVLWKVEVD